MKGAAPWEALPASLQLPSPVTCPQGQRQCRQRDAAADPSTTGCSLIASRLMRSVLPASRAPAELRHSVRRDAGCGSMAPLGRTCGRRPASGTAEATRLRCPVHPAALSPGRRRAIQRAGCLRGNRAAVGRWQAPSASPQPRAGPQRLACRGSEGGACGPPAAFLAAGRFSAASSCRAFEAICQRCLPRPSLSANDRASPTAIAPSASSDRSPRSHAAVGGRAEQHLAGATQRVQERGSP